ncbi:MAG TPA: HRDC domain-containing protein [Acidimicrobiales bacterium]|nr:HRDC domain-containing protein [Acidimicrobiales bacterium]
MHELVTTAADLDALVRRLSSARRYALDTEFHRERTYWPQLALIQITWDDEGGGVSGVAVIDPLAVDVEPLAQVLAGPGLMVAHAAEQDLEVLERACGRGPSRLFDTQVAGGFAGYGSASLSTLSQAFLGREVPKGDRLTDWRRRPLTDSQLAYAAADVEHLIALADSVIDELERRGRLGWAEEECEVLRSRAHGVGDPARAWWKLRDSRALKGGARGVAQEVAAWRERRAQETDQPVRSVLPDLALLSIAHRPPASTKALSEVRGLDGRHLRTEVADAVLQAVERGRRLTPDQLHVPPVDDVPKELRAAVALLMAWIVQVARDERIDPTLLATRSDVAALLRRQPDGRLSTGWRAEMIAGPARALIEGRASLAFDGIDRLVLEDRSGSRWKP